MNKLLFNSSALKSFAVLILLLGFGCFSAAFSQSDKRIEETRRIYQETNKKIAECEANGDTSTTFLTEMFINKNNGPYPAVGIYKTVIKFYYTFGDREKNQYPDRLLKINLTTNRAAMTENYEFLFNEQGQLIFYFEKKDGELRVYFAQGKPILLLEGEKRLDLKSKRAAEFSQNIFRQQQNLEMIFRNSLEN
jgi:hypothetical protein